VPDRDIVQIILDFKEWQTFECKRAQAAPSKILETVVAFANAEGGLLVLGLEDPDKATAEKRIIGISENLDNISEIINLIPKEISPPLPTVNQHRIPIVNVNGIKDELLMLDIERSTDVHSLKRGDTYLRRGRQNHKLTAQEIIRLKYAKGSIRYESEPAFNVDTSDLDGDLLRRFQQETGSTNSNILQFLKDSGLTYRDNGKEILSKAAVLLFAKNPTVTLRSKCGIKISHYFGVKPAYSGDPNFLRKPFTIEGPLLYQIQEAYKYLETWLINPPKLKGATFRTSLRYPKWALQEAITNAVIHRDYSIQNDIQLRIFDNRIEMESPGIFPGHVTVANLRTERFARNPIILRTLNRFGNESPNLDIGEGVDRMFKTMKGANLYDPIYFPPHITPNSVLLFLFNIERVSYWDTVSKYLDKKFKITNRELRRITGISDTLKASRLLKTWAKQGLLEEGKGVSKKMKYYHKTGVKLKSSLFS